MKQLFLLFISLFASISFSFSQSAIPDFRRLNMAHYFMAKKEFGKAILYSDSVTKENVFSAYDHLVIAKLYLQQNDSDKMEHHLMQAASKGYKYDDLRTYSEGIFAYADSAFYQNLYDANLRLRTDTELYAELKSMHDLDQFLRNKWMKSRMKDSIWVKEFKKLDTIHAERITKIIDTKGWQGHNNLVLDQYFYVLFLHISAETFDQPIFEKYEAILRSEVEKGKMSPGSFALWVDRHRIWKLNKKAIYGTFWKAGENGSTLAEVEDVKKMDEFRQKIGLLTLRQDIERKIAGGSKIVYPEWYK